MRRDNMGRRVPSRGLVAVLAAIVVALSCGDPTGMPTASDVGTKGLSKSQDYWATNPEAVALSEIARGVAVALQDEDVRQRIKRDMRSAPLREHKLNLNAYISGPAGNPLLARLQSATRKDRTALLGLLRAVRPLEFYMPVPEHRETWTGGGEVLVASVIEDSDPVNAYNSRGERLSLSSSVPPSTPTFVLVPVETDFSKVLDPINSVNINDAAGEAIGTRVVRPGTPGLRRLIEPGDGGGSGSSSSAPVGLYMTFSRLVDMGEPWTKGDPEIEVHIHGPTDAGNSQYGADLACAGEHAAVYRTFDQNNVFWSGQVLLFTAGQIEDYNMKFSDGFNVLFWEDDDTACTIKTDKDMLKGSLQATSQAFGGAAVKLLKAPNWVTAIAVFVGFVYDNADWLLSNDDFLGTAIESSATGDSYTDATHTILNGTGRNGRAKLVWK